MSRYEDQVARKIQKRAEHGVRKYGVSMERTDLTRLEWLRHAQEEAMDLAVYLERLIHIEESPNKDPEDAKGHGPRYGRSCEGCPYPDTCSFYGSCRFRHRQARGGARS